MHILNIGTRRKWMLYFKLGLPYVRIEIPSGRPTDGCTRACPNVVTRKISLSPIGNRTQILQSVACNVIDGAIRTMTAEGLQSVRRVQGTSLENIISSVRLPVSVCISVFLSTSKCLADWPALPASLKRRLILTKYKNVILLVLFR